MHPAAALRAALPANRQADTREAMEEASAEVSVVTASPVPCIQPPALAVATKHAYPSSHAKIVPCIARIATSPVRLTIRVPADRAGNAYVTYHC